MLRRLQCKLPAERGVIGLRDRCTGRLRKSLPGRQCRATCDEHRAAAAASIASRRMHDVAGTLHDPGGPILDGCEGEREIGMRHWLMALCSQAYAAVAHSANEGRTSA
jgi:hypothetical protein